METILKIRRLFFKEKLSRREIAKRLRLNRRTVSKHLNTIDPPQYTRSKQHYPKLGEYIAFIEEHLLNEVNKPSLAMNPGQTKQLDKSNRLDQLINELERVKAQIRAKVEHLFRVIQRQFGYIKTRYKGLAKNTNQIIILFALSNLWMARKQLLQLKAQVRP